MPSSTARKHALSTRTIKRFTPYTRAAQAHGAEPEAIHGRVATEGEAATRTIRPQRVRILSGHFAFLFRADSAHISNKRTRWRPEAVRRLASTQPAVPAPTMM